MIQFKACPRCWGDLELESNEMGDVEASCVQCGLRRFARISDSQVSLNRMTTPARHDSLPHITRPRVPGDGRTRRGGVHRRVLTAA